MLRKITALIIVLCTVHIYAHAQSWELGVSGGAAGYLGDLNQRNLLQVSGPSFGGFVKYNFNGYVSLKASYMHARVQGADSTSRYEQFRERNLSFITPMNETALTGEFNFLKYIPQVGKNRFTPFIYAGIGGVKYTPKAKYNGQTYDLRPLKTEGQAKPYNDWALAIPYGAGIKYNIAGRFNLIADIGYRSTNTDYLDDVSGIYAPRNSFANPIALALSDRSGERTGVYLGAVGSQRGDLRKHDTYMFMNFTISYTFITEKCYFEK